MKSSELRIGNYIQDRNGVDQVYYLRNIGALTIVNDFDEEDYTGIPLTEEWLLKFGFEKSKEGRMYLNEDFYFENGQLWIGAPDGQFWRKVICPGECKDVHQLQNLYFALTGEELTIKEPTV